MKKLLRLNITELVLLLPLMAFLLISLAVPKVAHAAACQAPPTTYGTDNTTMSVPNATNYTIWVRIQAPSSTSNSIMLQVDNTCFNVGGKAVPSWTWVNYQNGSSSQIMQIQLSSGSNSVELIGTQPGIDVDSILALSDPNCIPVGTGTNCTTGQPATTPPSTTSTSSGSTSTPASGSTQVNIKDLPTAALSSSGTVLTPNNTQVDISNPVTIEPTYAPNQTIKEVKYYLDKKLVSTVTKSPFTYYLNTNKLSSGKYMLVSDTIYDSGQSFTASETINVKHSFFKNLGIILVNNLIIIVTTVVFLGVLVWLGIKYRKKIVEFINKFISKHHNKPGNGPTQPVVIEPTG